MKLSVSLLRDAGSFFFSREAVMIFSHKGIHSRTLHGDANLFCKLILAAGPGYVSENKKAECL